MSSKILGTATVSIASVIFRVFRRVRESLDNIAPVKPTENTDDFDVWEYVDDVDLTPTYRHVDVDLYYRIGDIEKAQEVARQLRPIRVTVGSDDEITDRELRRVREKFRDD